MFHTRNCHKRRLVSAHERTYSCSRGDQQKHLSEAGKPIDLAALKHSSPSRRHNKNKLETLRKHLPIESHEKHCSTVVKVATTLRHKDMVKEWRDTKHADCHGCSEENGATKPEDPPREAPDQQTRRPRPAPECKL